MPIYKLCNFFRSSRGRNDRQHSGARDPGQKRRGGGGPNKSWQQDRQCTLLVLQRAVDLLQLLTLKVAKMPAFETDRFVDASLGRSSSAHQLRCQLERSTTLEEEDDGSELRSGSESGKGRRRGRRRRGSKRIFFGVPLMIAITVCTTCCAFLMEPKRALTDVQSPVIDFLVPVYFPGFSRFPILFDKIFSLFFYQPLGHLHYSLFYGDHSILEEKPHLCERHPPGVRQSGGAAGGVLSPRSGKWLLNVQQQQQHHFFHFLEQLQSHRNSGHQQH